HGNVEGVRALAADDLQVSEPRQDEIVRHSRATERRAAHGVGMSADGIVILNKDGGVALARNAEPTFASVEVMADREGVVAGARVDVERAGVALLHRVRGQRVAGEAGYIDDVAAAEAAAAVRVARAAGVQVSIQHFTIQ